MTDAGLSESDLAPTWLEQFDRWRADVTPELFAEPDAVLFSTATPDGVPGARTVLCKGADERGFAIYTNRESRKGREVAANPRAALVFPWYALRRQVIVDGTIEPVGDSESDAYWLTRARASQLGAWASAQSTVIADRSVLEAQLDAVTERFVDDDPIPRPPHWGGLRVVPSAVEFWHGRRDRLHDRLRYRRDGDAWIVERVSP